MLFYFYPRSGFLMGYSNTLPLLIDGGSAALPFKAKALTIAHKNSVIQEIILMRTKVKNIAA